MADDASPYRARAIYEWRTHDGPYQDTGWTLKHTADICRFPIDETTRAYLCALIASPTVSAWGRSSADPQWRLQPIEAAMLGQEPAFDLTNSSITASPEAGHQAWEQVRIIPAVEAPNAARLVDGLSLTEAFREIVMQDVLVDRERDQLSGLTFQRPDGTKQLAGDVTIGLHYFSKIDVCEPYQRIAEKIEQNVRTNNGMNAKEYKATRLYFYFWRISDRSARLIAKLRSADILAIGQPEKGKERIPIDPSDWQRPGMAVDFERGDLIDIKSGAIEWRSIVLVAPQEQDSTEPATTKKGQKVSDEETDQQDELTRASNNSSAHQDETLNEAIRRKFKELLITNPSDMQAKTDKRDHAIYLALKTEEKYKNRVRPSRNTFSTALAEIDVRKRRNKRITS